MRGKKWAKFIVRFAVFAIIFVVVFGWAMHYLWNLLMPELFGLPHISFWQAPGLLALSWLLFGGWRGMPRGGHRGRWRGLTPEERERFANAMRSCRSRQDSPADGPQSPESWD